MTDRVRNSWIAAAAAMMTLWNCLIGAAEKTPPSGQGVVVPTSVVSDADRRKIEEAIPVQAPVQPLKPRKLLVFDLNVGYGGHRSIPFANLAFELMGRKTGAFTAVVRHDPAVFRPDSLRQFDAVFLNNTVGNLFEDPGLRESLMQFVYGGGGLLGVHGTSVAFTRWPGAVEDWPEFGLMLSARGANHREPRERVFIKLDDPRHPLNAVFGGQGFEYYDEFFRFHDPYSRDRVRVLLSIDTQKTDLDREPYRGRKERADDDYALAWVRNFGRGRVFYCTIAHNPEVFQDPKMLRFYLGAVQFALGDLAAPTLPSAKLTPAALAQERLGWRPAVTAYTFHKFTLFETIDKTVKLGLPYLEGLSFQKVSKEIPKDLDPRLTDEEIAQVRRKLDAAGVRMLTYYYHSIPGDEAECRKVFEFGRKLGIEAFLSEPDPKALDTIERFCNEYGIGLALHNHDPKASPHYWHPEKILKLCQGRGPRIGACGDLGYWIRSGVDPVEAARILKDRLLTVQVHDLHERTPEGHDVPWGTGAGQTARFFEEIHAQGIRPLAIGFEYSRNWLESMPEVAQSIAFFNDVSLRLAK
jgi:sugar phosphate isomerase/epimerase/type 1 glutamine amidotransferase